MRYNFLVALALSVINSNCLPCCQQTTQAVQLLNCNLFWAEFPPTRAGKMLSLQGLLAGGGVTQQAAASAFAAAGTDSNSGSLWSLQVLLRPLAAQPLNDASIQAAAHVDACTQAALRCVPVSKADNLCPARHQACHDGVACPAYADTGVCKV